MASAKTVDEYIAGLGDWQREVATELRRLIREAAPQAIEAIKWAQPVYSLDGPVCYIKSFSKHVNLGFWRGSELPDAERLEGSGDKMRHLKFGSVDEVSADLVTRLVTDAVSLNGAKGDPTKAMPRSAYVQAREKKSRAKAR